MPDWKVQVNWPERSVEVRPGASAVRLSPEEDAQEVGQRVIDAAWNASGMKGWALEVATAVGWKRNSFEGERARGAFRSGVEAMGGTCKEVER